MNATASENLQQITAHEQQPGRYVRFLVGLLVEDLQAKRFDWAQIGYAVLTDTIRQRGVQRLDVVAARDALYQLVADDYDDRAIATEARKYSTNLSNLFRGDSEYEHPPTRDQRSGLMESTARLSAILKKRLNGRTDVNSPAFIALAKEIARGGYIIDTIPPQNLASGYLLMQEREGRNNSRRLARTFMQLDADPKKLEMILDANTTLH